MGGRFKGPFAPRATGARNSTSTPNPSCSQHNNGAARSGTTTNLSVSGTSTSTAKKATRTYAEVISTAFPMVEFGIPKCVRTPGFTENALPADAGQRFLKTRIGALLMAENSAYIRTVHQYAIRACRLHGRRLLVLGAGSSNAMMPLISRGPSHVSFVDMDQNALSRLSSSVSKFGLETASVIEYHLADVNDFIKLPTADSAKYDVVLCTKALGQILRTGTDAPTFMHLLADHLAPGADVLIDQHDKYTTGTTVGEVATPDDYDLATIGGRFADDVCYDLLCSFEGYDRIAEFKSSKRTGGAQVWTLVHMRVPVERHATARHVLPQEAPFATLMPCPKPTHDPVGDAAVPINARGAKAVLAVADRKNYSPGLLYPKVDGVPGVLHLATGVLLFISSLYQCAYPIRVVSEHEFECSAELVKIGDKCLFVVNGLISADQVDSDPLSVESLAGLETSLKPFFPYGVLVSSPSLLRHVTGNVLPVRTPSGLMSIPLDGVHVSDGRQNGLFYKPGPQCTVDSTPADAVRLITDASDAISVDGVQVGHADTPVVWEYALISGKWTPVRERKDKLRSDKPGSIVHTLLAAKAAYEAEVHTVEELYLYLRD